MAKLDRIFDFYSPRRHGGTAHAFFQKENLRASVVKIFLCLLLTACGNSNTPLDADTRHRIDSTAAAQIRLSRTELDSICELQRSTVLPQLVDSIKKQRRREIEKQMRSVPK